MVLATRYVVHRSTLKSTLSYFLLDIQLVTQKDQAAEEGHSAENQEDVLNALRSQLEGQSHYSCSFLHALLYRVKALLIKHSQSI